MDTISACCCGFSGTANCECMLLKRIVNFIFHFGVRVHEYWCLRLACVPLACIKILLILLLSQETYVPLKVSESLKSRDCRAFIEKEYFISVLSVDEFFVFGSAFAFVTCIHKCHFFLRLFSHFVFCWRCELC